MILHFHDLSRHHLYYDFKLSCSRISLRHGALNASTRRKSKDHRHAKGEPQRRPEWALFGKVTEGAETILFREKFADWPEPGRIIKMKGHERSVDVIKVCMNTHVPYIHVHSMSPTN